MSLSLLLIVSASLGACGTFGKQTFVAAPVKLVNIPVDVKTCLAKHVKLPEGDWTVAMVSNIVAKYQTREEQLEDCVYDVVMWYKSYQRKLASKG